MKNQRGAALTEYSSTLVMVALVAVSSLNVIGFNLNAAYQSVFAQDVSDYDAQFQSQQEGSMQGSSPFSYNSCGGGTGSNCDGEVSNPSNNNPDGPAGGGDDLPMPP